MPSLRIKRSALALLACLPATAAATERDTAAVRAVAVTAPSVVAVHTRGTRANPLSLVRQRTMEVASEGSGVVIHPAGIVLTNAHVVAGASTIELQIADGQRWPAALMGLDTDLDVAVLRVEGAGLPAIPLGTSADLKLGETVIAIGNPYGLGQSITVGVISQSVRELQLSARVSQGFIQTDAAINPGNSGGALVNLDGQLIGINTAGYAGAQNIGFAIPVDRALKVAWDLAAYGAINAPWLGADIKDVYRRQLASLAGTPLEAGAVVLTRVHPDSPAAAAGLRGGDVLYQVDDRPIRSRADLNAYLAPRRPGDKVKIGLYRGGAPLEIKLETAQLPPDLAQRVLTDVLGITVETGGGGARVTSVEPGKGWSAARLRTGDVILAVDGQSVTDPDALLRALSRAKAGHRPAAAFTVARGRHRGTLSLPI